IVVPQTEVSTMRQHIITGNSHHFGTDVKVPVPLPIIVDISCNSEKKGTEQSTFWKLVTLEWSSEYPKKWGGQRGGGRRVTIPFQMFTSVNASQWSSAFEMEVMDTQFVCLCESCHSNEPLTLDCRFE